MSHLTKLTSDSHVSSVRVHVLSLDKCSRHTVKVSVNTGQHTETHSGNSLPEALAFISTEPMPAFHQIVPKLRSAAASHTQTAGEGSISL